MNTFVEAAINLPPVSVCDNLRKELISNGFVERVRCFLLEDAPSQPVSLFLHVHYLFDNIPNDALVLLYHQSHHGHQRCTLNHRLSRVKVMLQN